MTLRMIDQGHGWTVVAEWFDGEKRVVFRADPSHHPFIQIGDCIDFIHAHKENTCD